MISPYTQFVQDLLAARQRVAAGAGDFPARTQAPIADHAPRALVFSPHPDDECIIGALPLRLRHEVGFDVANVAVTQGSRVDRQAARWEELGAACKHLGFRRIQTVPGGLTAIKRKTREQDTSHWANAVARIAEILREEQPKVIFVPHAEDWNSTHIGTHWLVMDALAAAGPTERPLIVIETEYWGQLSRPNLLVGSSPEQVAWLVEATSLHVGEVARNPYHLVLPAWMQDTVRRGAEVVGEQGGAAPAFSFGTLYRVRGWQDSRFFETAPKTAILDLNTDARDAVGQGPRTRPDIT